MKGINDMLSSHLLSVDPVGFRRLDIIDKCHFMHLRRLHLFDHGGLCIRNGQKLHRLILSQCYNFLPDLCQILFDLTGQFFHGFTVRIKGQIKQHCIILCHPL